MRSYLWTLHLINSPDHTNLTAIIGVTALHFNIYFLKLCSNRTGHEGVHLFLAFPFVCWTSSGSRFCLAYIVGGASTLLSPRRPAGPQPTCWLTIQLWTRPFRWLLSVFLVVLRVFRQADAAHQQPLQRHDWHREQIQGVSLGLLWEKDSHPHMDRAVSHSPSSKALLATFSWSLLECPIKSKPLSDRKSISLCRGSEDLSSVKLSLSRSTVRHAVSTLAPAL